jgi:hypothetical protein
MHMRGYINRFDPVVTGAGVSTRDPGCLGSVDLDHVASEGMVVRAIRHLSGFLVSPWLRQ